MPRELVAVAPRTPVLREYEEPPLGERDIRMRIEFASPIVPFAESADAYRAIDEHPERSIKLGVRFDEMTGARFRRIGVAQVQ